MITMLKKYFGNNTHLTSVLFVVAFLLILISCSAPSDEEMINDFKKNKIEFEKLLIMLKNDQQLWVVTRTWVRPEKYYDYGIRHDRIEEYRAIMKNIGLYGVGVNAERKSFYFDKWSSGGISIRASSKGYFYTEEIEPRLTTNLDTYLSETDKRHYFIARKIDKNWYIYLEE